jgi:hypothetical protein
MVPAFDSAAERLAFIEREVDLLAREIAVPPSLLPTYGKSEDMARPHIEVAGPSLSWVVIERGKEIDRKTTRDVDELLYWIFRSVIADMASRFAARNPVAGREFRYPMFIKELELMGRLNRAWRARLVSELGPLLREAGLTDPR